MKFPEFMTYCKLKDLVVEHVRLDNEWHADKINKQKLVIENDNFLAAIIYTQFTGEYHILDVELYRVSTVSDYPIYRADFGDVLLRFV